MNSTPEPKSDVNAALVDFAARFCERYRCPQSEFEERAFCKCLPWRTRLLAPLSRKMTPDYFDQDFLFVRYLGQTQSLREAMMELSAFIEANGSKGSFARKHLRIRISARRAGKLLKQLYGRG